jgi:hypothetical protein
MYCALYLEYEAGQRMQDLRALSRALGVAELQKGRSESRRSRLARRLVTLGLRLDPQAASSAARMRSVGR